ncbi:hypothetical protein CEXT_751551 [Caerostris extrusa]|uniref:Uncharacterized protein n=1 Tax=Caerostris extrusa TaxID=172846 RepID=A0AAV4NR44_CAEEX|nr:hypothetical protein CEXT_751551 [Caerostris extrusa]
MTRAFEKQNKKNICAEDGGKKRIRWIHNVPHNPRTACHTAKQNKGVAMGRFGNLIYSGSSYLDTVELLTRKSNIISKDFLLHFSLSVKKVKRQDKKEMRRRRLRKKGSLDILDINPFSAS